MTGSRRPSGRLAVALAAAAIAVAIGGQPARAGDAGVASAEVAPADPEARRLAEQGLAHFEAGRYDDAVRDLGASYRITPAPGLLYNLAQAHRLNGDCAVALDFYRRFMGADPSGTIRQRTEARVAEMERCVANAQAAISAPPAQAAAVPASPLLAPAPGKIDLSKPMATPTRAHSPWRRHMAIGLGSAAVAFAGGSAYLAKSADQAADDVSRIYGREGSTWGPYAMGREQDGQRAAAWSIALGVSAAISAALAAWMYIRR